MDFLLPSIYKPFYINVLFARRTSYDAVVIIDVYNGIGLYDEAKEVYDVGIIKLTFKDVNDSTKEKTLKIYRDKPLFNTSYKESITTVFTDFVIGGSPNDSCSLTVEYISPYNEYGVQINRDIRLEVNLEQYNSIQGEPFFLYHDQDGGYNIWYDNKEYGIETNLRNRVIGKSNNFLYYVVNEGFMKYFINPKIGNATNSYIYQSYNNNEVNALRSEDERIKCDLNPNYANYNSGNGVAYLPTKEEYDTNSVNYCITTPFFRMYPSINSEPILKPSPFAVRLVDEFGTIKLERDIIGYELDENLTHHNFYLIGVKSPLTSLSEIDYDNECSLGSYGISLRPEQDYVTVIEYISRIKVLKEDEFGYLVPEESYEDKYE